MTFLCRLSAYAGDISDSIYDGKKYNIITKLTRKMPDMFPGEGRRGYKTNSCWIDGINPFFSNKSFLKTSFTYRTKW